MAESKSPFELVRQTILEIYSAPSVQEHFVNLGRYLSIWDDKDYSAKEFEGLKIFEDLQGLCSFLENRNLNAQSDEVFRLILHTFPEKYFPSLPWLKDSEDVDYKLLEDAGFVIKSRKYPDYVQESFRLFQEQFHKVNHKLPAFIKEVEMNMFRSNGAGMAGELFRLFADFAENLDTTKMKDIPWTMINQLAMKLNNRMNAYNAAYLLLKGLEEIRTVQPTPGLRDTIYRNKKFFLRNFYWQKIDESQANKDYSNLVFYIDKFVPLIDSGYERSNLLAIRSKALKNISEVPKGLVGYVLLGFALLVIVSIFLSEPPTKERLNLDQTRRRILSRKKGTKSGESAFWPADADDNDRQAKPIIVKSRTGLREIKPPVHPHNRKLNLYEIRHAVFQKMRLAYLGEIDDLSQSEQEKLEVLKEDYDSRCKFYKYDNEVREKVHWDASIHAPRIIQDAQDILRKWRNENAKGSISRLVENELLSLTNPRHVEAIVKRLKHYGYFKGENIPENWNNDAKRALLDFKVSNLGIVNNEWDMKTQKALFK